MTTIHVPPLEVFLRHELITGSVNVSLTVRNELYRVIKPSPSFWTGILIPQASKADQGPITGVLALRGHLCKSQCLMNIELIRERVHSSVEPFLLRLSDGRTIKVPHPDFIIVGKKSVIVAGDHDLPKSIDPLHVVSMEEIPSRKGKRNLREG